MAIVDQLMSQKLSSIDYANDYMKGVTVAVSAAAKNFGTTIKVKHFSYNKSALGPLSVIDEIKAWKPDFIIGPRFSNEFLLLQPYFKKTLVISLFASAHQVYQMPKNFYSMSLSDKYSATAITSFMINHFPKSNGALVLDAVDCMSCHYVANYMTQYYRKNYKNKKVIRHSFISDNIETVKIKKLARGWEKGYIIYTPNISYVSAVLITRLSNYLHDKNLIFVGDDGWGMHEISYIGKLKTVYPYQAYHLQDLSLDYGNKDLKFFKNSYKAIYGKTATDPISYASFHALYSVMSILGSKSISERTLKNIF